MPWTKEKPPKCATNWTDEQKAKCVKTANAVLKGGGTEQAAVFACIKSAGKTKHPGGKDKAKGTLDPAELIERLEEMGLGFVLLEGKPTQFEIEYDDGRMMALGAVSPDIDFTKVRALYFHNAILAREESNKNKDRLPPEEIDALATSIGGMPIDDEHQFESIIGVFTKGQRVEDNGRGAVSIDGLIWPQRFPVIAKEIVAGERSLSMEVWIASVTCSMCNEQFTKKEDYCAHLEHKEADRILHGVLGFGGAATRKPAGTDTVFDVDRMMVVATDHRDQGGDPTKLPKDKTKGKDDMELKEQVQALESQLGTTKTELGTVKTELGVAKTKITELEGELTTAKESLTEAQKATADLRWSVREQALSGVGYDEDKLKTDKETLEAMPDEAFDILFAALNKEPDPDPKDKDKGKGKEGDDDPPTIGAVVLGGNEEDDDDDRPQLVL